MSSFANTTSRFPWWSALIAYLGTLVLLVGFSLIELPPALGQMAIFIGYVALASGLAFLLARSQTAEALGLQRPVMAALFWAILAAGATTGLSFLAQHVSSDVAQGNEKLLADIGLGQSQMRDLAIILTICTLAPLGEEAIYRGIIMKGLFDPLRRWGLWPAGLVAAGLSAGLFALSHGGEGQEPAVVLVIGLSGVIYGLCYLLTGSLWVPVMAHALNNMLGLGLVAWNADGVALSNKAAILAMPFVTWGLLWLWRRAARACLSY